MYVNFFVPGRKIVQKIYNKVTGKRKKVYDKARKPYARVLEFYDKKDNHVEEICESLQAVYESLNPWELLPGRNKMKMQLGRLKK